MRAFGGVLEHPAHSDLWKHMQMPKPNAGSDAFGGFTIEVEQWWWGHRAVKPTWLYVVGKGREIVIPHIASPSTFRPPGGNMRSIGGDTSRRSMTERLPKTQRHLTPPRFAEWLVELAASCAAKGGTE